MNKVLAAIAILTLVGCSKRTIVPITMHNCRQYLSQLDAETRLECDAYWQREAAAGAPQPTPEYQPNPEDLRMDLAEKQRIPSIQDELRKAPALKCGFRRQVSR